MEQSIRINDSISTEQKIEYFAEVETIKSQLAKPRPDRSILSKAWNVVSVLSTVPGLVEIIEKVRQIIGPLVGAA